MMRWRGFANACLGPEIAKALVKVRFPPFSPPKAAGRLTANSGHVSFAPILLKILILWCSNLTDSLRLLDGD
jgi:hypothetical protein